MKIHLVEHQDSDPIALTGSKRDQLAAALPRAVIQQHPGTDDEFVINPKNYVGLIKVGGTTVEIAPKLDINRVLFLVAYSLDPRHWRDHLVELDEATTLHEAIARPFADFALTATRRGPLHGYRHHDDSLPRVKGRIRFMDQLRRHQRITTPLEVSFDDYTPDIDENRLLVAATDRLLKLQGLGDSTRHCLHRLQRRLADVAHIRYNHHHVPSPTITRLNRNYEHPLALARLILGDRTIELSGEAVTSHGLLFDMATIFEAFVHTALKEALGLNDRTFPKNTVKQPLYLDNAERVRLRPDLSWWEHGRCVMVGDVKYKKTVDGDGKEPDLYQLLAYTAAAQVDSGYLVYAAGESVPATHSISSVDKQLHIATLHLANEPDDILDEIQELAVRIRTSRFSSLGMSVAA